MTRPPNQGDYQHGSHLGRNDYQETGRFGEKDNRSGSPSEPNDYRPGSRFTLSPFSFPSLMPVNRTRQTNPATGATTA